MKRALSLASVAVFCLVFFFASSRQKSQVSAADNAIVSRDAEVEGVKLHYMTAGHGPALILLHGYAETSLMWKLIIPLLAQRFTVIAPDLPGIGDSAIPADGLDMKTAAGFTRWPGRSVYRKQKSLDTTSASWSPTPTPPNSRQRWRNWS